MNPYDIKAFIRVYLEALKFEKALPDLKDYHQNRYEALCQAFGFDFRQVPKEFEIQMLMGLFQNCARIINGTEGAFGGYLEAPQSIAKIHARHGLIISRSAEALNKAHIALMTDIAEQVYGPCIREFTSAELLTFGFDDSCEPDEFDYC